MKLTCVGLTTLDILGVPIDAIPAGGKTELIQQIRLTPAGTAGGSAVIASKLGLDTALLTAIGQDEQGRCAEQALQAHGVDTSLIQKRDDLPTSTTILTVNSQGERPNFHAVGAAIMVDIDDEARAKIMQGKYLHWAGVGTMFCLDGEKSASILQEARSKGIVTTCDFIAPADHTLAALQAVMPHIDYFMPSLEEAMEVAGTDTPEETAKFYLNLGAGCCIFKWGAKGSFVATRDESFRVPAFKIDVVDTTGCGDSYCAGFIAGLDQGWDLEKACRFGTTVSALVASGLGSDAGVVSFAETLKAMESLEVLD